MKRSLILLFLVILPGLTAGLFAQQRSVEISTGSKSTDKRLALVIGNSDYKFTEKLKNPVNDAADMVLALKNLGFEVISGTDQTMPQMRKLVREFGARLQQQKGIGLFYFAGHGIQTGGRNFLVPVDAEIASEIETEDAALDINSVLRQMDAAGNGFNIVILDACRNNPFARSWSRGTGPGGLAQINAPTGTFIAYATAPDTTAADGKGRNGLYTTELLKYLGLSGLKIEEVFKEVTKAVDRASIGKQIPWFSSSLRGEFYFRPGEANAAGSANSNIGVSEKLPAAEDVLNKYFEAVGAKTSAKNFQSLIRNGDFEGIINNNKFKGTLVETLKSPNKTLSEVKMPDGAMSREAFDGNIGWLMGTAYGFALMSGQQLENKKRFSRLNFIADVVNFKTLYPKVRLKGKETIDQRETLVIEATPNVGKADLFYFDTQTGLLLRVDYFNESSVQKGVLVPTQMYFEEYVEVNGLMIPFFTREQSPGYLLTTRFHAFPIKVNTPVDDVKFQEPSESEKRAMDRSKEFTQALALIKEAVEEIDLKNYDHAIALCTKAIEINPQYEKGYNERGFAHSQKGEFDQAVTDYSKAIELNPVDPQIFFNRGMAYFKNMKFDFAIESFNKAIELSPKSVGYYSTRAAAFFKLRQFNKALADCSKAIELDETNASLYHDRAVVYEAMGRKDLADADMKKYRGLAGK